MYSSLIPLVNTASVRNFTVTQIKPERLHLQTVNSGSVALALISPFSHHCHHTKRRKLLYAFLPP